MLSVFSCECGLLQCPATVFGERLQRILSFRGGRTEPLFVYSISRWCVCAAATLKLSMTVASVQVTPAVSSLLEFETIRASLETSGAVQDSFCPFCTLWAEPHRCMTCYNGLFMHTVGAWCHFGRCSVKRCPRFTAADLPGSFSWQACICAAQKFITPTYRETSEQPNLGPRLQRAVALLTFAAQCSSYPSTPLEAKQHSNLRSGSNQFGERLRGWGQF